MMKKRKTANPTAQPKEFGEPPSPGGKATPLLTQKTTIAATLQVKKIEVCGVVKGRMPAARDGHTAVVLGDQMIIFGGDRHRMPFADTYSLNIRH